MTDSDQTVADLGEFGLLAEINAILPGGYTGRFLLPYGDDCAAVPWSRDVLLVSSDAMVEGIHFSRDWTEPEVLAWKSLASAVSDLAAKGAEPVGALVTLGLPPETQVDWILRMYRFWGRLDEPWSCPILGGDTVRSPVFFLDVLVFGKPVAGLPVSMAGAREGDCILVTGTLGDAAAGLEILQLKESTSSDSARSYLVKRFLTPVARVGEIRQLLQAGVIPTAMTDISDGLARSVSNLCAASGVGAEIEAERLPVSTELDEWAGSRCRRMAWQGGEDYEILLTVSGDQIGTALEIARQI
nr:thiamine-phosphate kinase [bacterium]